MDLTSTEAIEFAKLNAGVVQPSKTSINPYYLGIKIFEDSKERYNNPTEDMKRRGINPGSEHKKISKGSERASEMHQSCITVFVNLCI